MADTTILGTLRRELRACLQAAGMTQEELGFRIHLDARQIRRMLDERQRGVRLDDFDAAFAVFDKRVEFTIVPTPGAQP